MNNSDLIFKTLEVVFFIVSILSATMVVAHFTRISHWSVRMFDFPVKQMVLLQVITSLIMLLVTLSTSYGISVYGFAPGVLSVVILSFAIWPYTPLHVKDLKGGVRPESDEKSLSVMCANVFMENTRYDLLLNHVDQYKPDCLLLLETDLKWARGMEELKESYPYTIQYPLGNTYGLLFFSKLKIHEPEIRFLLKSDIPSIKAKLEISPGVFNWFYGVHPEPPSPTESDTSEPRDIELLKLAKEVRELEEPVIFAGDFNDVAWSHTTRLFRRFSGLLDPRIGRGSFSTFHVKYPLLRWPLDHCFLSSHFTINTMRVLPSINSDHFPILIDMNIHPRKEHVLDSLLLEDRLEVKDKLENEEEHAS